MDVGKAGQILGVSDRTRKSFPGTTLINRILSLHYSYATLYTLSPVFLCSQSVWTDLASVHEGYQHLERARDAAFAVIKAICSVSPSV